MSKLRKHDLVSVMGLPGDFRVEVISAHAHTAMVLPRRGTLEPRTYPIGDLILLSRPVEPGDIICQFRPGADFTNTAPLSKFTVTSHLEAFKAWGAAGWKHSDGTPIEDPPGASEAVVEEEQKKPEPVALRSGDVVESRTSGAVGVVSGFKREIPHALGKAITLAVEVTWRDETKASMLPGDLRLLGRMLKKGDRLVSPRSDHNGMVFTINQRVRPHDRTIYMVPTKRPGRPQEVPQWEWQLDDLVANWTHEGGFMIATFQQGTLTWDLSSEENEPAVPAQAAGKEVRSANGVLLGHTHDRYPEINEEKEEEKPPMTDRQRANHLADLNGKLHDEILKVKAENQAVLAENATLRRKLERIKK